MLFVNYFLFQQIKSVVTQNLITTVGLMVTAVLTLLRMFDLTKVRSPNDNMYHITITSLH